MPAESWKNLGSLVESMASETLDDADDDEFEAEMMHHGRMTLRSKVDNLSTRSDSDALALAVPALAVVAAGTVSVSLGIRDENHRMIAEDGTARIETEDCAARIGNKFEL